MIFTPPLTAALLPGITRDTILTLAGELGYEVREQNLPREALYLADELFFTGTAAEVSPIRSVDGMTIGAGKRGPITTARSSGRSAITNIGSLDPPGRRRRCPMV